MLSNFINRWHQHNNRQYRITTKKKSTECAVRSKILINTWRDNFYSTITVVSSILTAVPKKSIVCFIHSCNVIIMASFHRLLNEKWMKQKTKHIKIGTRKMFNCLFLFFFSANFTEWFMASMYVENAISQQTLSYFQFTFLMHSKLHHLQFHNWLLFQHITIDCFVLICTMDRMIENSVVEWK